jgi:hypothetical protein
MLFGSLQAMSLALAAALVAADRSEYRLAALLADHDPFLPLG